MREIDTSGNNGSCNKTPPSNKKKRKCPHKVTVAINEEGYAGVYCLDCDEQVEKEC